MVFDRAFHLLGHFSRVLVLILVLLLEHPEVPAEQFQGAIRHGAVVGVFPGFLAVAIQYGLVLHGPLEVLHQAV